MDAPTKSIGWVLWGSHSPNKNRSSGPKIKPLGPPAAAGSTPKSLLTEKAAAALVRKIRKTGLQAELAQQFILNHAPQDYQSDYLELWESFIAEAMPTLQSDFDYALKDALALLRRECNVGP